MRVEGTEEELEAYKLALAFAASQRMEFHIFLKQMVKGCDEKQAQAIEDRVVMLIARTPNPAKWHKDL